DRERHEAMIDRIIATYDCDYFKSASAWGATSELPAFIIGMPRSGSTLVEQILANHPRVCAGGEEAGDFRSLLRGQGVADDPYWVPRLASRDDAQQLAAQYLERIGQANGDGVLATNKSLLNFMHLGLIATLFPKARIIHCRRDPRDVCLSCYCHSFR